MLENILQYKLIISIIITAIVSQTIKIILHTLKDKKGISLNDFIVTGGMPSTHSAIVSALFVMLLIEKGLTELTVISFVLFVIVITDSMGVRRTAGEEGSTINKIIKMEKLKIDELHYARGHKPKEVIAGIVIGFFVALLIFLI